MIRLSPIASARLLIAFAVMVLAVAVWGVVAAQRSAAERSFQQSESAQLMLAGMLGQQTGARGFALTGQERFLVAYHEGRQLYSAALTEGRSASRGDRELRGSIEALDRTARQWQGLAVVQIAQIRRNGPRSITTAEIDVRKRVLDRFRRQNASLRATLAIQRKEQLARAGSVAVAVVLALSALFGLVGHLLVQRSARGRRVREMRGALEHRQQAEFTEGLLIARDEREADNLLKRHLERVVADADVAVFASEQGTDGLRPMTALPERSPLREKLGEAAPEDCMAIRLGRPHDDGPTGERMLRCELCGAQGEQTYCVPAVRGNEVMGSVLVRRAEPLDHTERARVRESVAQSAPVLTNLRTVVSAELRAITDQLTGLPNKRAVEDALDRMEAQAGRSKTSLAAIVMDIDHFKRVNDTYGHAVGDQVLAAVGATIATTIRASDFAGRYGGEEFVLLLLDTGLDGAVLLAEKVRLAIEHLDVPQLEGNVTVSLGIAVLPDHASRGESLLREADRALFVAKNDGRNRVQAAVAPERSAQLP